MLQLACRTPPLSDSLSIELIDGAIVLKLFHDTETQSRGHYRPKAVIKSTPDQKRVRSSDLPSLVAATHQNPSFPVALNIEREALEYWYAGWPLVSRNAVMALAWSGRTYVNGASRMIRISERFGVRSNGS